MFSGIHLHSMKRHYGGVAAIIGEICIFLTKRQRFRPETQLARIASADNACSAGINTGSMIARFSLCQIE